MDNEPDPGGTPETFGKCTECGAIYPAQKAENGGLRPVGTDGSCRCGNTEFTFPAEE